MKMIDSCQICEPIEANKARDEKEDKKKRGDAIQGASSGEVTCEGLRLKT